MTTMLDPSTSLSLDQATLDRLFRTAQTAYGFTDEPVTADDLERIADLLEFPPTAMNSQPLRVVWVASPEAKARLLPLVAPGNHVKAASAPVVAILAAQGTEPMARFNATLQAGYFILAARAAGLAVGPMGGFDAAAVDEAFLAGTDQHALLLVNLGHAAADGHRPRRPRLPRSEAFRTA